MSLIRLSEHVVWMPPGPPDRPSLCAVTGTRGTLMLDSGASDAHARLFLDGLAALNLPHPRLVAFTHWHWDHVFGAAEIGAPVIAGRDTASKLEWLARLDWTDAALDSRVVSGEEIAFCADNMKLELPTPRTVRICPADIIFENNLTIAMGGVTCRLLHVGGDHSADSVVMLVEPDGVLFLGDCLYDDIYAPTRHYTTARLFPLLDTLSALPANRYVEGHSPDTMERAAFDRLVGRFRLIGALANAYPGDSASVTAAYVRQVGSLPDEDTADLIRAFAACPLPETQ